VELRQALQHVGFPAWIVDPEGRFVWQNDAAVEALGDVRGRLYPTIVAPAYRAFVREQFTRKLLGQQRTDFAVELLTPDGSTVPVEVSSVRLEARDGMIQGIFGLAAIEETRRQTSPRNHPLTERQAEVLRLLAAGCSTTQIAVKMGISVETVRNHVRPLLRKLGAHSRLEAVALARREGMLPDPHQ